MAVRRVVRVLLADPPLAHFAAPREPLSVGAASRARVEFAAGPEPDARAFDVRGQHHARVRAGDPLQRADAIDQALQRLRAPRLRLEHQRVDTGHVVAFEDVVDRHQVALQLAEGARALAVDADEHRDVVSQTTGVELGDIARDHSGFFELADALDHGGGFQAHLVADRRQGLLAVLLEQFEYGSIGRVEFGGDAAEFH